LKTKREETDPCERQMDGGKETNLGKGNGKGDGSQRALSSGHISGRGHSSY